MVVFLFTGYSCGNVSFEISLRSFDVVVGGGVGRVFKCWREGDKGLGLGILAFCKCGIHLYADCQCVSISIFVQIDTATSNCRNRCIETLKNMAERAVEQAATQAEMYYAELLLSARGICKGCAETFASLNAHLHRNIVKIYCPAPGCYATTMDTPASIDRHWNKLHASLDHDLELCESHYVAPSVRHAGEAARMRTGET